LAQALAVKQAAIELHVVNNFTSAELIFENMRSPAPELFDEWVRCSVQFGDSFRSALGTPGQYRHPGVVFLQVFIKEGIGINRGVVLADELANLFRDQVVSGINFWVPRVIKVPTANEGWFQVQVMIPFYFDEVN